MVYESSYESGRQPYRPDVKRGHWAAPTDYMWACLGLAFKMDIFTLSWFYFFEGGILGIIPYLLSLFLYVVPLMVVQAFMGQFSSSGFISTFRISPLFKGMGYISLVLNVTVLFYYTLFAAVPLFFLLNSLRPTLPWSCDSINEWSTNVTEDAKLSICNLTNLEAYNGSFIMHHVPSVEYFKSHFNGLLFTDDDPETSTISFSLMFCIILTWVAISAIFYYCHEIERFGRYLRYGIWTVLGLLFICLVRFSFLPGAHIAILDYFTPNFHFFKISLASIPIIVINSFGGGWGSIMTLASYNNFKVDIMTYSWIICIGQMFIMIGFSMVSCLVEAHFRELTDGNYFNYIQNIWVIFLSSASAIASMELPNLWSILFYGMLTLSSLILMATQLLTLLTSIFDEFEVLRSCKFHVTHGVIGLFALLSLYFCTNYGVTHFAALSADALFSQSAMNLLLLLVVLWIYGRERFQRDIEFMLSKSFNTWRVQMLRFVSPVCLLYVFLSACMLAIFEHIVGSWYFALTTLFHTILPWMLLPGYAVYLVVRSSGPITKRIKRACRPNDWYPVEPEQRQRYEETIGNVDTTHQLTEVTEDAIF